ncbi:FK506-binding protein 15 isoform X1 [Sphaerodactylus townsendi]|uniref:FK506-binding protein 15 isoform X1 n=1 Tax=Sphaerodactylus townsendi TaxID=933632 RepID=UPI002026C603|nr:FK506-binding protein 15 isoform X1 [Sphaerodactylus townsendi]XP_048368517.1 FK506-binding protein 15 isoform X1 [Sphaerodactylus townsendi]
MFGGAEEDDADFLSPTGGTRLASLFELDQTVTGTGNEFFQYTAPKQPKKGQPATAAGLASQKSPVSTPTSGPPSVFIATAVHAYRFSNGQYVKQGKYGAAVVGSHSTKEYRILLYINQQQQVTAARIHSGFVFTVQPNNYSTFYDDQRQNWSIMFESEKAAMDFNKQLCIAKYNSITSPDLVLHQDLIVGEGQGVEIGDSLEVAFTGWLFQNCGLGQVFDSNVNKDKFLRLKLGSGKIIKGWEEGMTGMKKGGKRFLVIPPALAYGSQGVANCIPPDSTLAFEVDVKRVRLVKDSGSNGQNLGPRDSLVPSPGPNQENVLTDPAGLPPSTLPPKPGEPAVRAKFNSISEHLPNPDVAKAKLISRMAKMGQPMLPFLAGTAPAQLDLSDSEMEDPNSLRGAAAAQPAASSPLKPSPQTTLSQMTAHVPQPSVSGVQMSSGAIMPAALQSPSVVPGTAQAFQPYAGVTYAYPQASPATSQLQPVGPMYPSPFQVGAAGDIGSFLITEARQQNTEIRLAVGKMVDKIDHLSDKVNELQKQNSSHSLLSSNSSVTMETAMIMSNIQRIIQENERLKQEIFEKSSRIEEQNEKISELIDRNQRYVEQNNLLMEKRNTSLQMNNEHTQARVLHAEQEKHMLPLEQGWDQVKVAEELAAATAQISRLQLELTSHQKKEMDLRSQLNTALKEAERHGTQLNQLQAQLAELQQSSEDTRNKFQVEKQSRRQLDVKTAALEEELCDLRVEKENLEKNLAERKKKSLLERGQAEEEMDELRRSYQEELDKLRQLLKKARTSTDQAASEQLSLMQVELESQWEAKCERMLSSAKEQHARQYQEVCEQRDAQQQKVSQLEEKLLQLKTTKGSEDEKLSVLQEQLEQLEPVKSKYLALQSQVAALKAHYEERIQDLEKHHGRPSSVDSTEEVKKIMNQVFQSLRGQFELEEPYTGREVLGIVMNTIKTVTLQLLERHEDREESSSEDDAPGSAEEKRASPVDPEEDPRSSSPLKPPLSVPSVPPDPPKEALAHLPSASPEGGEGNLAIAMSEAQALESHTEQTSSAFNKTAKPDTKLEVLASEEEGHSGCSEQVDASAENEICSVNSTLAAAGASEPSEPTAEEAEHKMTESTLDPDRGETCLDVPNQNAEIAPVAKEHSSAETQQGETPKPSQVDSGLHEDQGSTSKGVTHKSHMSGGQQEEDEDEELSMKGRPPPTPLFGDDDDDDDLDWLG